MIEPIVSAVSALLMLYPYFYIKWKKGKNEILFVSSCIGFVILIQALTYAFSLPFMVFTEKFVPSFAEAGHILYLLPLLHVYDLIETYFTIIPLLLFYMILPPIIYRRYLFFQCSANI